MIGRHVETTFCDDIRHEVSNKLSYIGVYSGNLYVQAFPVALPKLCVAIKVVTPRDKPLDSIRLRILKDDETFQEITVDEGQLSASMESLNGQIKSELKNLAQTASFVIVFSPMQLDGPCTLRVRVAIGDEEELKGIGLVISQFPQENLTPKH